MPKLTAEGKARILELWSAARECLQAASADLQAYPEQGPQDPELAESISLALQKAHRLKFDSLLSFPEYQICEGRRIGLVDLYDLQQEITKLFHATTSLTGRARDLDRLSGDVAELESRLDRVLEKAWDDAECQEKWKHLRDMVANLRFALARARLLANPWATEFVALSGTAGAVLNAFYQALLCLGGFPYWQWVNALETVDLTIEIAGLGVLLELVLARDTGSPWTGLQRDPKRIGRAVDRAAAKLDELKAKLDELPLEGQ